MGATSSVLPTLGGPGGGQENFAGLGGGGTGRLQNAARMLSPLCRHAPGVTAHPGCLRGTDASCECGCHAASLHKQRATGAPDRMFPGHSVGLPLGCLLLFKFFFFELQK